MFRAINETLSRTVLTSATVFFVTLAMNVFGVGVIRDFAFAMNVGVIVGTYSSIFFATPLLVTLRERTELVRAHTRRVLNRRKPTKAVEASLERGGAVGGCAGSE